MSAIILSILFLLPLYEPNQVHSADHAIYVSVLEIGYNEDHQKGSIKLKIFADDLEDAIHNQSGQRYDLMEGDCDLTYEALSVYLAAHLQLSIK